jgi:hypothetical protein
MLPSPVFLAVVVLIFPACFCNHRGKNGDSLFAALDPAAKLEGFAPACFQLLDGAHGHRRTDAATSTVDHIAFEIALAYFADERTRLEALGLQVETAEHAWVHWRSLYLTDPEGNQVESVCYDESV